MYADILGIPGEFPCELGGCALGCGAYGDNPDIGGFGLCNLEIGSKFLIDGQTVHNNLLSL